MSDHDQLTKFNLVAQALDVIAALARSAPAERALEVLRGIEVAVSQLRRGLGGTASVEACRDALAELQRRLGEHDRIADLALDAKFPRD